jgi:SNF2 family DNA or RNA helicase
MQPSVRFTLEDVGELPPYISRVIDVPLGPKQADVYEKIRKHALDIINGQEVSAANKGVALNKLLQISLGYVYTSTKGVVALDNQARIDAVLDIIDASDQPVIIFMPFKHAMQGYTEAIRKAGYSVVNVSGDTPPAKRGAIFNDFQNLGKYKVLLAHPQCLAHSITLTASNIIVWVGPIASLEIYDQANARIRRTGQTRKQQFIHLQGTPAERRLYKMLIDKQDVQNNFLSLFEA